MKDFIRHRILGVIPARGASKAVPRKNVRLLCGKPLVAYTIEVSIQSNIFFRLILSTDDQEVAQIGLSLGAEVPFLRPKELAEDSTPMLPVIQHAIKYIEGQDSQKVNFVATLQPSAPLRTATDLVRAAEKIISTGCDSVIGVVEVDSVHPILMKQIVDDRIVPFCIEEKEGTRRQDYVPKAYMRAGSVYLARRDVVMNENSLWGKDSRPIMIPRARAFSIDHEIDLLIVEQILNRPTQ